MSTTTVTTTGVSTRRVSPLVRTTVAAGAAGGVVTTAVAAAVHAAGVPLAAGGEIPLAAFAQFAFIGAVLGGLLVAFLNRRSIAPRRRFVQLATALTALTCLAPVSLSPSVGAVVALIGTHLVAAAIIVPALARRANA
ncbi:MAG: DUF6069 family protein [Acidimicrobiales bacterium]